MAEMCSAYPVAGGQYSWVTVLAPKKVARGLSYICRWFILVGILAMGAANNFIVAKFILGVSNLKTPTYGIQRWHTVLMAYAISVVSPAFIVYGSRLLEKLSRGLLVWNVCAFVIIIVVILAANDHKQLASFVFQDFVNLTIFGEPYAAIIGLLQSAFGMCCYDAPAHMTEEIHNARKAAPRAIIISVCVGAVTGFVFLVAACFCIGDIETTALSTGRVPVIESFYSSTAVLLILIGFGASNALTATGGRAVYAFSRDRGLPFSDVWSKVGKKNQIPVWALCL